MDENKFEIKGNRFSIHSPIRIGADGEEDVFLHGVERVLASHHKDIVIDLQSAGSVSSTVLALCIAACRKASQAGKQVTVRLHKRNTTATRLVGLDRLATVEFV